MLEAQRLTKYFNRKPVVKEVSFFAQPGEIVGYLGPNGAGKSTTAKMIVGLIHPSAGQVRFEGRPIEKQIIEFKARLGYVPNGQRFTTAVTGALIGCIFPLAVALIFLFDLGREIMWPVLLIIAGVGVLSRSFIVSNEREARFDVTKGGARRLLRQPIPRGKMMRLDCLGTNPAGCRI